MCDLYKMVFS